MTGDATSGIEERVCLAAFEHAGDGDKVEGSQVVQGGQTRLSPCSVNLVRIMEIS